MILHIFKCSTVQTRSGLTVDRTGSNLPINACGGGIWQYDKSISVNEGDPARIGAPDGTTILEAINRDGYYINDFIITFEEKIVK
jgi:hypothetical protein